MRSGPRASQRRVVEALAAELIVCQSERETGSVGDHAPSADGHDQRRRAPTGARARGHSGRPISMISSTSSVSGVA